MVRISCGNCVEAFVLSASGRMNESGDSVILDFANGFFAIADGSGRSPELSRSLLLLASNALDCWDDESASAGGEMPFARAARAFEDVLGKVYGMGSSTLSGVIYGDGVPTIVVHTGDSSIFAVDRATGEYARVSRNNFWMAGKSLKMFQVEEIAIERDAWVMMASDGMMEIIESGPGMPKIISSLRAREFATETGDMLYRAALGTERLDDAALLLVRPSMTGRSPRKVLLGGAPPAEKGSASPGEGKRESAGRLLVL